jgi:hypothetical protein
VTLKQFKHLIFMLSLFALLAVACSKPTKGEVNPTTQLLSTPSVLEVPLIMNRGAPANNRCVVNNPHPAEDLVNVYAAPNLPSALVAQLGNWADVLQIEDGWYKILIPQGGEGWVQVQSVTIGGDCAPD